MQPLSSRQQSILNRVIDQYIETAQPVGSHAITAIYTEIYQGSYSSATVRHEMGSLEQMGYLTHPHTSAGRVPTDLGYRFYVDHGLQDSVISQQMINRAEDDLLAQKKEAENLAENASSVLSEMVGELSVFILPGRDKSGHVVYKVFLKGFKRMFEKPEFQDLQKIRVLMEVLEERIKILEVLNPKQTEGPVRVTIGKENTSEAFSDCSIISAGYAANEAMRGACAVIGPTRMRYNQTVPLVEKMSKVFSRVFSQLEWEEYS